MGHDEPIDHLEQVNQVPTRNSKDDHEVDLNFKVHRHPHGIRLQLSLVF